MWKSEQRRDYRGGSITDPSQSVIRLQTDHRDLKTWIDLFEEFIAQPNIAQVKAISIGMWVDYWNEESQLSSEPLGYIDTDNPEEAGGTFWMEAQGPEIYGLENVFNALMQANQKLSNLEAIYVGDFDEEFLDRYGLEIVFKDNLNDLFMAYPKLRYFGYYEMPFNFDKYSSESLTELEINATFSTENRDYSKRSDNSSREIMQKISGGNFPNLDTIRLQLNPMYLDEDHIVTLKSQGKFRSLRRIYFFDPNGTSNMDWYAYKYTCADLLLNQQSKSDEFGYFDMRLDFSYE